MAACESQPQQRSSSARRRCSVLEPCYLPCLLTLQRHLIHFFALPVFGGGVLRHLSSPLMLSNRRWISIPCLLGGWLPPPGQRVRKRLRAAQSMVLLQVKLRAYNLFSTTKISCGGDNPSFYGAIRSLSAACGVLDRPGGCASAPTRPTPARRQSYTSAAVKPRLTRSAAATPSMPALFFPKRSFKCQRKKCANIVVSMWWCHPGYLRIS
jgi:hypothetical protein